jgi:hypothetical protein
MSMNHRRNSVQAVRFAERRRREDEAPRLIDQVPNLKSLRFEIEDRCGVGATTYTRPVLVDRAPALFLIQCGDPRCIDGEHDLTWAVMQALRQGTTSFEGEDKCGGSVGSSACPRVLHFGAAAEYAADRARSTSSSSTSRSGVPG